MYWIAELFPYVGFVATSMLMHEWGRRVGRQMLARQISEGTHKVVWYGGIHGRTYRVVETETQSADVAGKDEG